MNDLITYVCRACGEEVKIEPGSPTPICCEKEMERLPACMTAPDPEMARNYGDDEPCDDGTDYGLRAPAKKPKL